MPKAIIFDLDGTLINTLEDLTASVNYVLAANGFPERDIEEIRKMVGNGIKKLIERALPDNSDSVNIEKCYEEMLSYYKSHSLIYTKPYEGITRLLDDLNRNAANRIAVVTNKAQMAAVDICRKFFGNNIHLVLGDDKITPLKPQPDNVHKALKLFNCDKTDAVYIGDSEVDLATAKAADIKFIAVSWGFRDKSVLIKNGAKVIADNAKQLLDLLR